MRTSTDKFGMVDAVKNIQNKGRLVISANDVIKFENVPLITPNSDILIESLSFTLKRGESMIIVGPNGTGKSSVFRVLGNLWPLMAGQMERPDLSELFYIPQKPYLSTGSLKHQITYPNIKYGARDEDQRIIDLLKFVNLHDLFKQYGLYQSNNWSEILSGGQKQRIALARLLFHQPKFAILDECSSMISKEMEREFYSKCREMKISLFTISHRQQLIQYHEYKLEFLGNCAWKMHTV